MGNWTLAALEEGRQVTRRRRQEGGVSAADKGVRVSLDGAEKGPERRVGEGGGPGREAEPWAPTPIESLREMSFPGDEAEA